MRLPSSIAERLGINKQDLDKFTDDIPAEDILEKIEHHERNYDAGNKPDA